MLEDLQKSLHFPPFLWNILLGCAAVLTGFIIKFLLAIYLKYTARNITDYSLVRSVINRLGKPINYLLPVMVFNMVLPFMELAVRSMTFLNKISEILLIISFGYTLT